MTETPEERRERIERARPAGEAPAAITNSFAFGGTNAVLALRRAG